MNEKTHEMISYLRKDARASLASISKEINMPISTIYDKVNRLHKDDVIRKFTTLVNFSKLGFHYHAKIAFKVFPYHKEELLFFLQKNNAINSIYVINNGFDFLIETVHRDVKGHLIFVKDLQEMFSVEEMLEFQIIDEIEREKFL